MKVRTLPPMTLMGALALSAYPLLAQSALTGGETPLEAAGNGPSTPSGVSAQLQWGDFDGDGLDDALAVQPDGTVKLLRNAGDGSFVDATVTAGLDPIQKAAFAIWQDYDKDGQLDLFVGTLRGASHLLQNQAGALVDVTAASGIDATGSDRAAHWVDYDADGRLDLHLVGATSNTLYHALPEGGFEAVDLPTLVNESGPTWGGATAAGKTGLSGAVAADRDSLGSGRGGVGRRSAGSAAGTSGSGGSQNLSGPGVVLNPTPGNPATNILECVNSLKDAGSGGCISASSTATLGMLYPLSDKFFVEEISGRVGVGTTTPLRKLHVVNGTSGGTPTTNSSLVVESSGESSISVISPINQESSLFLGNASAGPNAGAIVFNPFDGTVPNGMVLRTDDTNRISISEGGNVGVGINSPTKTLHVSGGPSGSAPTTNSTLVVENDGEASISVIGPINQESSLFLGNASAGPNAGAVVFNPFDGSVPNGMVLRTDDTNRISISENGNVGVGINSPTKTLHVSGGDSGTSPTTNSTLVVENDGEASISVISPNNQESSLFLGNASAGPNAGAVVFNPFDGSVPNGMALRTADTNRISISSTGNVGVGVDSPTRRLHVSGGASGSSPTTNSTLVVENNSESSISVISPTNQECALFFGNSASGANAGAVVFNPFGGVLSNGLVLRTADSNRLAITSAGNVGVGTLTPSFTFEVNGSAGKPGGGSWSVSSDRRLKKNIQELDGALATLLELRGVTFEYKDPKSVNELAGERLGFIAQEVEEVMPDWVEEVDGYKRLTIRGFEALAVEAIRELEAKNAELEARVAQLEAVEADLADVRATLATLVEQR